MLNNLSAYHDQFDLTSRDRPRSSVRISIEHHRASHSSLINTATCTATNIDLTFTQTAMTLGSGILPNTQRALHWVLLPSSFNSILLHLLMQQGRAVGGEVDSSKRSATANAREMARGEDAGHGNRGWTWRGNSTAATQTRSAHGEMGRTERDAGG
jgi:hypothetical protein